MNRIDIGTAIRQRLEDTNMSKAEFARRMGMPQQNVNRLLARKSMDTDRLAAICEALGYNFFALYAAEANTVNADAVLAERVKHLEVLLAEKERTIKILLKNYNNEK